MAEVSGASETIYDVHTDHLDTPKFLTNQAGAVVWRATHKAYGEAIVNEDTDGNGTNITFNLRFPGQYFDKESDLHYNRFRYYDTNMGRYITADPIGQRGGVNIYSYVGGNPVNFGDLLGLYAEIRCERCGKFGKLSCKIYEDGVETGGFTSNEGGTEHNHDSDTEGDPYGENGPLPPGIYDVPLGYSPKFDTNLPSPTNTGIPGSITTLKGTSRSGIRIHAGLNSKGCLTTGLGEAGQDVV